MRVAWLECATGISGDMTLAALIDAGVDFQAIQDAVASLNLPDVRLRVETVIKNGFRCRQVLVDHPEQHAHRHLADIRRILDEAQLTGRQRHLADTLFTTIAEAEAQVHGSTAEQVHFHEVGAVDSIVDLVGAAVGFDLLGADQIVCSPVPTGRGFVHIAHGICPIPAPGTAEILKGIPLADVPIEAELTTPTGAAIVRTLADRFGPMPPMTIQQIGYGCGTRTFSERANILRLFVGESAPDPEHDTVVLLETNLDDVPGETVGYTRQQLTAAGALDVYTIPVQMKKDRPGVILSVLCRPEQETVMEDILFRETGTLGIRRHRIERCIQHREQVTVTTPWGEIPGKCAWRSGRPARFTPEFDDCARIARNEGVPLRDVFRAAETAFLEKQESATLLPDEAADRPSSRHTDARHDHHHDHDHDHHH